MKTRISIASCPEEHLTAFGLDSDKVIYFDIETTGFRASTSSLYMIGWAVQSHASCDGEKRMAVQNEPSSVDEKQWTVTQIMAESASEERLLLEHFRNIMDRYDTIIEFNGDRFDLPYMREKYEEYGMDDPFSRCQTVDLGIGRQDRWSGGELIDVYRSVRDRRIEGISEEEAAVNALFLHNYEDVLGMLAMTPLLAYPLAMQSKTAVRICRTGQFNPSNSYADIINSCADTRMDETDAKREASGIIEASFDLPVPVPKPLHLTLEEFCDITFENHLARIHLRPFSGSLCHFFPDYRNYYYLPEEDTAIHKSVASFVAASHREKAKAQNCYVKKQGTFLPLAGESGLPVFQRCYKDPVLWVEYTPEEKPDPAAFSNYIHRLIMDMLSV